MGRTIWTVTSATVDGVLFRTIGNQDRKKTKTDNSCLMGEVEVITQNGRSTTTVRQRCYGRVKRFILHFQYPPPPKDTYKLNAKKLADIEIPWILCAECHWYEHLGTDPRTGLERVQPNHNWDACSLHNMRNTFAANIALWPEVPFNDDHFDDAGEPKANIVNGAYDFSGQTTVLNVINA